MLPSDRQIDTAVTHLNAPVGLVVTAEGLSEALRSGSVSGSSPMEAAIISGMFVELSPRLISLCASEAMSDIAHANMLYHETLKAHLPRVVAWEKAIEHLL